MPQTLVQLFGPSAIQSGNKITISALDFRGVGLNTNVTVAPAKFCAAYLKWLHTNTKQFAENATAGISADTFTATRSFVERNGIMQIQNPLTFNIYTPDTTREFDPDAVY